MNPTEAQTFLNRQRFPRFITRRAASDTDLLRRRERLFNGLTMFFGTTFPLVWIVGGTFADALGSYSAVFIWICLCRQCSARADRCRDVREFFESTAHPSTTP